MPILDLTAYKPAAGGALDAIQIDNGFQAIVNTINALDSANFAAGRIFDPAKLMQDGALDGDGLVWDNVNTKWVPASAMPAGRPRPPRMVVSALSGGPPASPVDQDIWIATSVDANGTRWSFQYNAGSASAFKWEFIGGAASAVEIVTQEATALARYVDLATVGPQITIARAGDYEIAFGASSFSAAAGSQVHAAPKLGAATTLDSDAIRFDAEGPTQVVTSARTITRTGLAAAAVIKLQYGTGSGGGTNFLNRNLAIRPARVS